MLECFHYVTTGVSSVVIPHAKLVFSSRLSRPSAIKLPLGLADDSSAHGGSLV